ncbi:hypothetical protein LJC11_03205 [Bacteroidales bacterium OttesenSCG-928-I21]|nr:hypothetical protein [Bacteroidales bacterium OttesenSCG-928-I21]
MNIVILQKFDKDLDSINNKIIVSSTLKAIEVIMSASRVSEISNLKKIKGHKIYFRIKVGTYRIGLKIEKDTVTLIRILPRKDIYKYFP